MSIADSTGVVWWVGGRYGGGDGCGLGIIAEGVSRLDQWLLQRGLRLIMVAVLAWGVESKVGVNDRMDTAISVVVER